MVIVFLLVKWLGRGPGHKGGDLTLGRHTDSDRKSERQTWSKSRSSSHLQLSRLDEQEEISTVTSTGECLFLGGSNEPLQALRCRVLAFKRLRECSFPVQPTEAGVVQLASIYY